MSFITRPAAPNGKCARYNAVVELMTIGYEGLTLDTFFALLRTARTQTLVDVRQMPLSRKPGFSKTALRTAAESRGLTYLHLPPFGCPRPIRDTYRTDRDWERYTEHFLRHLTAQDSALREMARRAQETRCCLLCFEADFNRCHRSLVAEGVARFSEYPLRVRHLTAADALTHPTLAAA